MKAEIITIGDEILIGQILDSNSKFIAEELTKIGISVVEIISIEDNKKAIINTLIHAKQKADVIIITGGLGPTNDDVTKKVLSEYFNDKLVVNNEIENHIVSLFKRIGYNYTDADLKQAHLPERAKYFKNNLGTASGMWFEKDNKVIISLPGVPSEMKGLLKNNVLTELQKKFKLPYILHRTIITHGEGESNVAKRLEQFEKELPKKVNLAYLPSYDKTRLRLTVRVNDYEKTKLLLNKQLEKLMKSLKNIVISSEDLSIEQKVLEAFKLNKVTLSTAESCTGGQIASMLTKFPGTSAYYKGSIVAYTEEVKNSILKVSKKSINKYSVVSAEVAQEMAKNCLQLFKSDFAIATTGNAGPTTDNTNKSVGVVFIAIASKKEVIVEEFNFGQPREKVIKKASIKALKMLLNQVD
jgi:nicotinamide-nucleotide amidase